MTYKRFIITSVALAVALSACTDEIVSEYCDSASSPLAARKIEKAEVTTRADDGNTNFPVGTAYNLWAYENAEGSGPGTADFIHESRFSNIKGEESNLHYVTLQDGYTNKIKGNIHIYGFTDGTENQVKAPDDVVMSDVAFPISLPATGDYTDYMAGYLHYDSSNPDFKNSSYAVIPFGHIMSQVNVKVVQYGEVSYHYEGDEVIYDTSKSYTDLYIKKISLKNAYTGATYCLRSNSFSYYTGKDTVRELWSTSTPLEIPVEIPELQEAGKPVTSNLVLPQSPSNTDKMQLELVICGDDAAKFHNELNESSIDASGNVTITLDLDNNTTNNGQTVSNALRLLSNYSYTLVVTFQSDNVRVVTIAPLIYPFFQGEGDTTQDWQDQAFEQPSVFDNIQWCDRYTGADLGYPSTIAEFQKSAGFYYQKNRTIPFYPTKYESYSILDNDYWPVDDPDDSEQMDKGNCWYQSGGGEWNAGWQWENGKIYYRYGGHWKDVAAVKMFEFPKVRPVVSFWLPEEMQITGLKQDYANYDDTSWELALSDAYGSYSPNSGRVSVFWNSPLRDAQGNLILDELGNPIYTKEGPNRYCRTVQEFIADDGVHIRKYWSYLKPDYNSETNSFGWYPVNKRLNWAMQIDKDVLPQYRTWDANTEDADLPCPPGWRLPTKQDFLSVFPGSAAAGNITFLDFLSFGNDVSTIAPLLNETATILKDPEHPTDSLFEIYVKTPFNVKTEESTSTPRLDPPLRILSAGGYRQLDDLADEVQWDDGTSTIKRQLLSRQEMGDPLPGYESEYVISKRKFSPYEYNKYGISGKGITEDKYYSYASKVKGMIARPNNHLNKYETLFMNGKDAPWGVIYAIKKVDTDEAYRLRYRIEKIQNTDNLDAYVLVVEQYKAYKSDRLKYKIEDINDKQYFLNYSWDYPDATLYFPITGMVGDAPCINGQIDKDTWVCAVFNYGTETILLSNEYENDEKNQAVLRIKIGGTNTQNQFIFQGMARLGLGGQVRAVRSFRTGGD